MKKLLMLGVILALGATAMAEKEELGKTTAPVYLQAEIISENLVVSGIDGRDIVLDFGQINKQNVQNGRGAEAEFKVEYVGSKKSDDATLDIFLENQVVTMKHTTINDASPMVATLAMSDRLGTSYVNKNGGVEAKKIKMEAVTTQGQELYRGKINGILSKEWIALSTVGFYEGATQLTVTLNGTAKN